LTTGNYAKIATNLMSMSLSKNRK